MEKAPQTPTAHSSESLQAVIFLLFTVLIWGIQPFAIKIVLHFYSIPFTAFLRSFVAMVLFGFFLAKTRRLGGGRGPGIEPISRKAAVWIAAGGIGLGVSNLFWNASLLRTTVGATSTLQLSSSVVLALYGIIFLSEGCTWQRGLGLLLSLAGMFLVSWNGYDLSVLASSEHFLGNMLGLLAGLTWGVCAIAQKVTIRGRSGISVVTPMFIISTMILAIPAFLEQRLTAPFNLPMLGLMILTGVLGLGVGNFLFAHSMRTIPASIGAAALPACPLISLTMGTIFLHEPLTPYLLIGGPLTSLGVAVAFLSMAPRDLALPVSQKTAAERDEAVSGR
jgi:drug/metabolite transporter (DMT)-like permease